MIKKLETCAVPDWATQVLGATSCVNGVFTGKRGTIAEWENGIVRVPDRESGEAIEWYEAKGGTNFTERTRIPFTMTSLDTPVYHQLLADCRPAGKDAVIMDIGAGDGRNTIPFLEWGYRQVIAVDPIASSLVRLRQRVVQENPDWLDRLLLVEADARRLPFPTGSADLVLAIETLCCLNEDFGRGVAECARILKVGGTFFDSERGWEGAVLTRLLYGGIAPMIEVGKGRDFWDGNQDSLLRTRVFTERELVAAVQGAGLKTTKVTGIPVLSVIVGYLRSVGKLAPGDEAKVADVHQLMAVLERDGVMRRSHVVVATK